MRLRFDSRDGVCLLYAVFSLVYAMFDIFPVLRSEDAKPELPILPQRQHTFVSLRNLTSAFFAICLFTLLRVAASTRSDRRDSASITHRV